MKRFIAVILAVLMISALSACGPEPEQPTAAPTEPPPQMHTVAPAADPDSEPEWAPVYSELELTVGGETVVSHGEFLYVALVNAKDGYFIRLTPDESAVQRLQGIESFEDSAVTLDGEYIASADFDKDSGEITLICSHNYSELCELATDIRGVETF